MTLPIDPKQVPDLVDERTTDECRDFFRAIMRGDEGPIDEGGRQDILVALSEMSAQKTKPKEALKAIGKTAECMPSVLPTEVLANLLFDSDSDMGRRVGGALLRTEPTMSELPFTDKDDTSGRFRGPNNYSKIPLLFLRFNQPGLFRDWLEAGGDLRDAELQRAAKSAGYGTDCLELAIEEYGDVSNSQLARALVNYAEGTFRHRIYSTDEGWTQRREFQDNADDVLDILTDHGLSLGDYSWEIDPFNDNRSVHPFVYFCYKVDEDMQRYSYSDKCREGRELHEEAQRIYGPLMQAVAERSGELTEQDQRQLYHFLALEHGPEPPVDIPHPHRETVARLVRERPYRPPMDEVKRLMDESPVPQYLEQALPDRALKSVQSRSLNTN